MACIISQCLNKADVSCNCNSGFEFLCTNHILDHLNMTPNEFHALDICKIDDKFKSEEQQVIELKSKIISISSLRSLSLHKAYEEINFIVKNLEKNLAYLDQLMKNYFKILNERVRCQNLKKEKTKNLENHDIFTNSENIKHDTAEELYMFKYFDTRYPQSLSITNPISLKTNQKPLEIPDNTDYGINICVIPNKKLFCFENCIN